MNPIGRIVLAVREARGLHELAHAHPAKAALAKERVDSNRCAHKKCERKHYNHADPARNSPRDASGFRATRALL